jgi:methionyl-tRNA formyltransferase
MRVVFIGTGDIGVPALKALLKSEHDVVGVVTQPDKPVARAQEIGPTPIKKAVTTMKIPLLQPAKIKDLQAVEQIRGLQPDIVVVMAYGQILPRDILEIPKIACLNLHASLLPRWRGAAPIQAAIAAGDRQTGVTVMYMDAGLDTGDILLQRRLDVRPDETGKSLHDRLSKVAPDVLLESLQLLGEGVAPRILQDNAIATYAPKLKRDDGKIDWSEPAEMIERKIRAFNPWPGTFTQLGGQNLKIFSASLADLSGKPGEILQSDKALIIAAGSSALFVNEVQLEGKRRMSAAEFLRGHAAIVRGAR